MGCEVRQQLSFEICTIGIKQSNGLERRILPSFGENVFSKFV